MPLCRNLDRNPDRGLMGLGTATTRTTDEDYDQGLCLICDQDEEEIQRPTKITIRITTTIVHRQQIVDRAPLSV